MINLVFRTVPSHTEVQCPQASVLLSVELLLRSLFDVFQVERTRAGDSGLVGRKVDDARRESLLALGVASGADLFRQTSRLGTDEPRLFAGEKEVEVFEGLAGRLDVCADMRESEAYLTLGHLQKIETHRIRR